jgi:hypothetical protein
MKFHEQNPKDSAFTLNEPLAVIASIARLAALLPPALARTRQRGYTPFILLLMIVFVAGCATPSTVDSREQERGAAYSTFSLDVKALVNQGEIKAGMTADAVYIAWGPPAQILQSGNQTGTVTTWLYQGGYLQGTRYWNRGRSPSYDYQPVTCVSAEVVFANGVVQSWRTLPQPPTY